MTKEQLWEAYVARNPSFAGDGNITLSAAGLRKMYEQTWAMAYNEGRSDEYHGESDGTEGGCPPGMGSFGASTPCNPFGDIFK